MPRIGVDEAGKGPVLGPMIAAAVSADPAALPDSVDDSKRIPRDRRTELADLLRDDTAVEVGVGVVETAEIDDPETDMNTLTVTVQARAIRDLLESIPERDPVRLIVDAGDVSEDRFARRVRAAVVDGLSAADGLSSPPEVDASEPPAIEVIARHGADEEFPLVGAASIVAKVERDRRIEAIGAQYDGFDGIGSGYPSDPTTKAFLESFVAETGTVPDCARRSWATCERVLAEREQSGLEEFGP